MLVSAYFQHRHSGAGGVFTRFFLDPLPFGRLVELVSKLAIELELDASTWTRLAREASNDRGYFGHFPFWVIGVDPRQYYFASLGLTKRDHHGPLLSEADLSAWFRRLDDLLAETVDLAQQMMEAINFPGTRPPNEDGEIG